MLAQAEARGPEVGDADNAAWMAGTTGRLDCRGLRQDLLRGLARAGMGHVDRALELKPEDPDALELRGTLGYLRWILNLAPDQAKAAELIADAEKDLRAAVDGNPDRGPPGTRSATC